MTKKRIWELDALRGLCIIAMVAVHLIFDLSSLIELPLAEHPLFLWIKNQGGLLFLLLSGLCVTLGSHSLRRGIIVFGCGMLCTLVTYVMNRMGLLSYFVVIRFGVLHCLGVCMLLWALFKRLPVWALAILSVVIIALGIWFDTLTVSSTLLFPLGLKSPLFSSGDYFPMMPNLGWFLLGAVLGRTLYRNRETLLPKVKDDLLPIRFLRFCGRHSLLIYLLHQPIITGLLLIL